jgi:general secretion pathway protein F
MAYYQYTGVRSNGKTLKGRIEAVSERAALELLNREQIVPVTIKTTDSLEEKKSGPTLFTGRRISMAARTLFVRELATFLHADIPLLEALHVMRQQESNPSFKIILNDVHDHVERGESFSKALANHPKAFPPLLVSMVKVGEKGGMLGKVLDQMANWMEHEEEVRSEIRGAMAYPLIILCLGIVTVIILMTFVLPRITVIFGSVQSLPVPTRILMATSSFVHDWIWALLIGVVLVIATFKYMLARVAWFGLLFDKFSLSAPIFGPMLRKANISRFARSTAALLSTGVPLIEGLNVVKGLITNKVMGGMIQLAIDDVTHGRSLARSLAQNPYFPKSIIHLLGVGERTGRLDEMFNRVADSFETKTRADIKILLNLLSPMLIVCLAVLVAFIAISILLPIFQMNQQIR